MLWHTLGPIQYTPLSPCCSDGISVRSPQEMQNEDISVLRANSGFTNKVSLSFTPQPSPLLTLDPRPPSFRLFAFHFRNVFVSDSG